MARTKVMNNEKNIDSKSLINDVPKNKLKVADGLVQRYIGEILLNIGDQYINEAEGWINKAIETNERNGLKWHLGRDYNLFAELLRKRGDRLKAKEMLNKAKEIFKGCGAKGWMERTENDIETL